MNNIKTKFSIKDLENLSGIKAHTIRIWEKRYNLFEPSRTDTNIRYYSLSSLQKLLNVCYLNQNGYKVSKIAELQKEDIPMLVNKMATSAEINSHAISELKMAMLHFDARLFQKTFDKLIRNQSFHEVFYSVFVPFLDAIGLLWQTDTITPAHEHFIVELIKQKIILFTAEAGLVAKPKADKATYVLFLPDNEIHELGLLFTHYELVRTGYHSIYLGQSVPLDSLEYLTAQYPQIVFISCFTVKPDRDHIIDYLRDLSQTLLEKGPHRLFVSGRLVADIDPTQVTDHISIHKSTSEVIDSLQLQV